VTAFFYTLFVLCVGYFVRMLQEPGFIDRIAPIIPNDDEEPLRDKEEVSRCFEGRP
jgi:hypothetical protein